MPEGDSIAIDALRLRPILVGRVIESAQASGRARAAAGRISGATVTGIRTHGKNLVVDFSTGYSLRVHLAMNGRWIVLTRDRRPPGQAKLTLTTADHHAICLGAPTVDVDRTGMIDLELGRLGPDLLGPDVDIAAIVTRARTRGDEPLANVLLDQKVAAGIGNVYKSELAFLAGVHPSTPLSAIPDSVLAGIFEEGSRLLGDNVRRAPRNTTGVRGPGRDLWVYGRERRGCRRCNTPIESANLDGRVTYWCPRCQPPPPG